MAATLEEYRDILIADTYVDLARLKMRAQHGIPSEIRAEVWKYLLDVSKPDKSEEVSTTKRLAENYWDMTEVAQNDVETLRAVKLQLRSYTPQWDAVLDAKSRKMIERIAGLMVRIITHMPEQDMKLRVARFVMLFKTIYPEINAALEEEEVEVNEWAVSWLRYLLCRELPAENALRLWDSYFAADQPQDGLLLHPYVCLAILEHLQGTIIELSNRSEIVKTLQV